MAIRRAGPQDLEDILELERLCFEPHRLASARSLRRSLTSSRQSVWVVPDGTLRPPLAGLLVLWHFPRMLRVYDVASHPGARGRGVGFALMRHAESLARGSGRRVVQLEADPEAPGLVRWYEDQGYAVVARLPGFYAGGHDAVRMRKTL
ncbi:MAG TPA: N-acetyltransferase [Candidatus Thermoplasmatota archaeon]|nr:N-acetyltransferase [Candidatus Thermoplasmatota archaeon]